MTALEFTALVLRLEQLDEPTDSGSMALGGIFTENEVRLGMFKAKELGYIVHRYVKSRPSGKRDCYFTTHAGRTALADAEVRA
jgi:hypothetical protein